MREEGGRIAIEVLRQAQLSMNNPKLHLKQNNIILSKTHQKDSTYDHRYEGPIEKPCFQDFVVSHQRYYEPPFNSKPLRCSRSEPVYW